MSQLRQSEINIHMRFIQTILMAIVVGFSMSSCVSFEPTELKLSDFPVKPKIEAYTRKPLINKIENNFIVTDEFVEASVLLKKYSDRIDDWKKTNNVK